MQTLTINQLLNIVERQWPNSGSEIFDLPVIFSEGRLSFGHENSTAFIRNLQQDNYLEFPLSSPEKQQLRSLDRKAKGGLLSAEENFVFERLLDIAREHGQSLAA